MKWEKVEFNDVLEKIVGGGTPSKTIADYWNGDIPWCSVKDMVGDKYQLYSTEDTITNSGLENSSSNLIHAGTVITSTRMGLGRAFINKVDMAINQDLKALIPNGKIDNTFLLWTIVNKKEEIEGLGIGSTVKGIRLEVLRGLKFNLPPLPTQRRIASILSAYDDLIENNLKRIKLLEEKAQLHYIQYKPVEKIALQDIADYLGRGVTPKYEEGSGFYAINQKANKGSLLEYSQFKSLDSKLEVSEDKLAKWGDLLINSLGEGTLGRVHFYTDKSDLFAVDQHMSIFRTQKQHYTFYLYQFLSSNYGQGLLDSLKKGGTNMTMLNISDLRQLIVSFPSEKELIEFWNICKPLFQLKQTLITQNTKLREARDILLPRLMNGEIGV